MFSLMTPLLGSSSAQGPAEMEVIGTAVNPANDHTYHLLSASSWEDAADAARGLDGFLTTIDNAEENIEKTNIYQLSGLLISVLGILAIITKLDLNILLALNFNIANIKQAIVESNMPIKKK